VERDGSTPVRAKASNFSFKDCVLAIPEPPLALLDADAVFFLLNIGGGILIGMNSFVLLESPISPTIGRTAPL
jgi:hypothetical protein